MIDRADGNGMLKDAVPVVGSVAIVGSVAPAAPKAEAYALRSTTTSSAVTLRCAEQGIVRTAKHKRKYFLKKKLNRQSALANSSNSSILVVRHQPLES
jgi:hypothetical protein